VVVKRLKYSAKGSESKRLRSLYYRRKMPRLRVRRLPPNTHELLLNLTNRHIHAQLVDRSAGRVIVAVHSNEPEIRSAILEPGDHDRGYKSSTVAAASVVGSMFGDRARSRGIESVTWVRPGRYHGKIKAFIDGVRDAGIKTLRANPKGMPGSPARHN
jgi:large subunit ribosomal protein L18